MTEFELQPTATRTGVIALGIGESLFQLDLLRCQTEHHIGWWTMRPQFFHHQLHRMFYVMEECLVSRTEYILALLSVEWCWNAILRASTVAYESYVTSETILREQAPFGFSEGDLLF